MRATSPSTRRIRRVAGIVVTLLLVVLAACGGDDGEGTAGSDDGGEEQTAEEAGESDPAEARELIVARDMDINSLDPQRAYCDTCQIYLTAVYETLIGIAPDDPNTQVPKLATEWSANEDNTEFTFTLDPAATFSDGSPVTAADVQWSWERLANLAGSASYLMGGLSGIETPDDQTVVVTFEQPNSAFLPIVSASYMGIVNSAVAEAEAGALAGPGADTDDTAEPWFFEHSAGSGPYVLESYTDGDSLVLARNESYWGDAATFPVVTMKQVSDATAQLQQLQQGDVDIAMQISIDALSQLEGDPNVTAELVDSYNFVYIALSPGAADAEPLADDDVRRAIKAAIDYDGMLDVTVAGAGRLQASPIPNGFLGSEDLPLPAQDIEAARELLEGAGYGDGFSLTATYPVLNVYGVDFDTMMQKVQQDLAAVGIELELRPVEFTQWIEVLTTDGIPITAVYFAPDHTDSSQYVQYFGQVEGSAWGERAGVPVDETEVGLLAEALAAGDDTKAGVYGELGRAMIDDAVIVPLVNPQLVLARAADITNMHYSACCNLELGLLGLDG